MTQSAVPLPVLLAGMATAVALLVWPVLVPREPRFVYNPSASVAPGWYRIERLDRTGSLRVGSTLLVRLPADVAALAAQRGYLPSDVPMLKRVGALALQSVCVRDQTVRIDGAVVADVRLQDGVHRPLQAWGKCRTRRSTAGTLDQSKYRRCWALRTRCGLGVCHEPSVQASTRGNGACARTAADGAA